jgi:hypothetical protein
LGCQFGRALRLAAREAEESEENASAQQRESDTTEASRQGYWMPYVACRKISRTLERSNSLHGAFEGDRLRALGGVAGIFETRWRWRVTESKFKDESKKVVGDLQMLRDEIKLQLHLAGADARDVWDKLEPQLKQFEDKVEQATETALDELRSKGTELKTSFEGLVQRLRKSRE